MNSKTAALLIAEAEQIFLTLHPVLAHKRSGQAANEISAEIDDWLNKLDDATEGDLH